LLFVVVELLLSGDYKVRDGGLVDEFKAVRLEFHWAETSKLGSEHYINDTAFPLEVRMTSTIAFNRNDFH